MYVKVYPMQPIICKIYMLLILTSTTFNHNGITYGQSRIACNSFSTISPQKRHIACPNPMRFFLELINNFSSFLSLLQVSKQNLKITIIDEIGNEEYIKQKSSLVNALKFGMEVVIFLLFKVSKQIFSKPPLMNYENKC
jgi:hypothetical protein